MLNRLKHWLRDLFRYPTYRSADSSYDTYWHQRDMNASPNRFQAARVRFIATLLSPGDVVHDIGCGDGRTLEALKKLVPGIKALGFDNSDAALEQAKRRGVNIAQIDIKQLDLIANQELPDWILFLEVLEHFSDSEALLRWASSRARRGVVFSVPNTGFIIHRIRLLLGRFPLQWKAHPSEHLRFWTLRDMRWWVKQLGYTCHIHTYEGMPLLGSMWPSLFAAGIIVVISMNNNQMTAIQNNL